MKKAQFIPALVALSLVLGAALPATAGVVLPPSNSLVSDAGLLDEYAGDVDVFARGSNAYAVWRDGRRMQSSVESDIYFASSSDGGATWSQNRRVSDPDFVGFTDDPSVSVAPDGSIWAVWGLEICYDIDITCGGSDSVNNDVRIAVSRDGGASWTESTIWDGEPGGISDSLSQSPQIHADDDRVLVLVHDPVFVNGSIEGFHVYLVTRVLSPFSETAVRLTINNGLAKPNSTTGPNLALAVNGNTVCAAWEDTRDRFSIYGACSADHGQTFSAATRWSTNGDDFLPKLTFAPDGRLYLAYKDVDQKDIVVRTSTDAGATWSAPRQATNMGTSYTYSYDLSVGPDNQMVMPVAMGPLSTASSSDLNVITSIDGGQTFGITGPVEKGTEQFLNISTQTSVAVAGGGSAGDARAVIAWKDDRISSESRIWAVGASLDALPPTAPGNLRATGGEVSVLLQWDPAQDANGVAYYDVYRATSQGGTYSRVNARGVLQTYFRDVDLPPGTYYYQVRAIDSTANASAPSNSVAGTAAALSAAPAINGVIAYDAPSGVGVRTLTNGAVGIEVLRSPGMSPAYSVDGANLHYVREVAGKPNIVRGDRGGASPTPIYASDQQLSWIDLPADANAVAAVHTDFYNGACIPFEPRLITINPKVTVANTDDIVADAIAISPDRRWLAYTHRIYCSLAGTVVYDTNRVCLVDTISVTPVSWCQPPANVQGVDFANTGNVVVISADFSGQNELWRATVTQSGDLVNFIQLTRGPAGQPSTHPRVSTDGNWVVFVRDVDASTGENLQAHIVRLDGDGVRSLGFAATDPVWSGGGPAGPVITGSPQAYLPLVRK